jgi:hypothetical protein
MKLEVSLLNVLTVADSAVNHMDPSLVGMFNPADGASGCLGDRGLVLVYCLP